MEFEDMKDEMGIAVMKAETPWKLGFLGLENLENLEPRFL